MDKYLAKGILSAIEQGLAREAIRRNEGMFSTPKEVINNIDISHDWETIETCLQSFNGIDSLYLPKDVKVTSRLVECLKKSGWSVTHTREVYPSKRSQDTWCLNVILIYIIVCIVAPPVCIVFNNIWLVGFVNAGLLLPFLSYMSQRAARG